MKKKVIWVVWTRADFNSEYKWLEWYVCISKIEDIHWREFSDVIQNFTHMPNNWYFIEIYNMAWLKFLPHKIN